MEPFSALLAPCVGNSPVSGEFPAQRPVTRSFDVFFDLRLNKRLSKQAWGWWFETLSSPLWRHCNGQIVCAGKITGTLQTTRSYALLFFPKGPVNKRSALVEIMVTSSYLDRWWPSDEKWWHSSLTRECGIRPQRVKQYNGTNCRHRPIQMTLIGIDSCISLRT